MVSPELLRTHTIERLPPQPYRSVDFDPLLADLRAEAHHEAQLILEQRKQRLFDGEFDAVPLPVDVFGTAKIVANTQVTYGENSLEHHEAYMALELDCQRLLAESLRKNTYEYFPPIHQVFGSDGEYYSHGVSITALTEAGLTPIAEKEEQARRTNEYVEEATYKALGHMALTEVSVRTISECTDWATEALARKSKGGYGGYVPEIQKFMVRDVVFDPRTGDRYEEQIGLPGVHITHEVITEALERRGFDAWNLDKTALHGTQLAVEDDLIDFVRLLDEVATEYSGQDIYMGEVLPIGHVRAYESVREQAVQRQSKLGEQTQELAAMVLNFHEAGVDPWAAMGMVEGHVKKMLLKMADKDNRIAAHVFDEETAQGLREVSYLRSIGQTDRALELLNEVEAAAPAPGYCGAGSCGLEGVDSNSKEGKELAKSLQAEPGDTIVKDKERACKCGKKEIVYAYNKNKVTKRCEGCGAFESKKTK